MNRQTLQLFLTPNEDHLELFDCTNLEVHDLIQIAYVCPNLRTLNLSICGRINGTDYYFIQILILVRQGHQLLL